MSLIRVAPWLIVAAVLVFVGKSWGAARASSTVVTETIVREVVPAAYELLLADLGVGDADGIRARLEAIERRPPTIITRTDTLVSPPDTVIRFVAVDSRGSLSIDLLTSPSDTTVLRVPELQTGIDVSDCDEGYEIRDGTVICDRARLGHLYGALDAGFHDALVGLDWERTYRSSWQFSIGRSFPYARDAGDRWEFRVRRRIRVW